MNDYEFDKSKSELLRKERGLGFEEIIPLIESGDVIDVYDHPDQQKHPGQSVYEVDVSGYVWRVPHIRKENTIRLITCYPCRKATEKLNRKMENTNDNEKKH